MRPFALTLFTPAPAEPAPCDAGSRYDPDLQVSVTADGTPAVTVLMDHYQLSYAALDLLIDPDDGDRWWLVDVNPAGQHGWIQAALPALGITQALARLLTTHHHPTPGGTR